MAATTARDAARHVALMTIEDTGHLNPLLALAEALAQEGWTVHFFVPHEAKDRVEAAGARWCHYGAEAWSFKAAATRTIGALGRDLGPQAAKRMPFAVVPATVEVMPYLVEQMREIKPEFIVHDSAVPWGWLVGKYLGIPTVCSMTALPSSLDARETFSARWGDAEREVLDLSVAQLRATYGLELNHNYSYTNYTPYTIIWSSRFWHKGSEAFAAEQFHYWGPLTSARHGFEDVRVDGPPDAPLVFVSLGTIVTGPGFARQAETVKDFYGKILAAARLLPEVKFLLSVGAAVGATEAEGRIATLCDCEVPGNVVAVRSVDQLSVLKRAKAFVTHCGQNSSSEAVLAGVPVVACPFSSDQFANAARFAELGCGVVQSYADGLDDEKDLGRISADSLAAAIRAVLYEGRYAEAIRSANAQQAAECGAPLAGKLAELFAHVKAEAAGLDRTSLPSMGGA